VEAILLKCLEKDPRRRYAAAAELARDLSNALEGRPVTAGSPASRTLRAMRTASRKGLPWALALLGNAALGGAALSVARHSVQEKTQLAESWLSQQGRRKEKSFSPPPLPVTPHPLLPPQGGKGPVLKPEPTAPPEPARTASRYTDPEGRFSFEPPSGWTRMENNPVGLQSFQSPDGRGVLVTRVLQNPKGLPLEDIARRMYRASSVKVKVLRRSGGTLGGRPALAHEIVSKRWPVAERQLLHFIGLGSEVLMLTGYGVESDFESFRPAFDRAFQSLRFPDEL
jgi:hypothetical protein